MELAHRIASVNCICISLTE